MYRVYRYRLYPTKAQEAVLMRWLYLSRQLYNAALQERGEAYKRQGKSISRYDQQRSLTEIRRADKDYADVICIEDLNVKGLQQGILAKQVSDAGWSSFRSKLEQKAEETCREVIAVDPRNTSQLCSNCGDVVKKDLSERVHSCHACGLVIDRDINAARVIQGRGLRLRRGDQI